MVTRRSIKPDTAAAMRRLIAQIRTAIPFDLPEAQACVGPCNGCSMKLLAFLESELDGWQRRLAAGERPTLGDLSRLASTGRKIHRVLERNGLIRAPAG